MVLPGNESARSRSPILRLFNTNIKNERSQPDTPKAESESNPIQIKSIHVYCILNCIKYQRIVNGRYDLRYDTFACMILRYVMYTLPTYLCYVHTSIYLYIYYLCILKFLSCSKNGIQLQLYIYTILLVR